MSDKSLHRARVISSIAATAISLACGTNYVYSAWGPQFAERLKLSSTEQNLIGAAGNLGMYLMGIPTGILVDARGPRPAVIIGAFFLGAGYFPLHQAYDKGFASVPLLCLFSFFTGFGGCCAFAAAIKTSALNWPHHRGTATAFPMAAFGLSAFFFSMFAQFVFPGSTGDFLLLLSCGTFGLPIVSFFFLHVFPHSQIKYSVIPSRNMSNRLHRTRSEESKYRAQQALLEPEEVPDVVTPVSPETNEVSSLMSSHESSAPGDEPEESVHKDHAHRVDIRGWRMLPYLEFWQLFCLMGILTGIGLMTINNIGNDAAALWRFYDKLASEDFITKRQAMHVSILSICSFSGRLLSGVGSDFLVKGLKASRLWCLTVAALVFLVTQIFALNIQNPNYLGIVSGCTGLAYGFLFGCFPSLVAEAFGIHGLSTNWGTMTLSPVISGNVFNIFYGLIYDKHSVKKESGESICTEGLECYRSAYKLTIVASVIALLLNLWTIQYTHKLREDEDRVRDGEHEA